MARAASRTPQRGVCVTTATRLTFGIGHGPGQMYYRTIIKPWFSRRRSTRFVGGRPGPEGLWEPSRPRSLPSGGPAPLPSSLSLPL
eukprot:5100472-Pyramimonas_sp.AAC.1